MVNIIGDNASDVALCDDSECITYYKRKLFTIYEDIEDEEASVDVTDRVLEPVRLKAKLSHTSTYVNLSMLDLENEDYDMSCSSENDSNIVYTSSTPSASCRSYMLDSLSPIITASRYFNTQSSSYACLPNTVLFRHNKIGVDNILYNFCCISGTIILFSITLITILTACKLL